MNGNLLLVLEQEALLTDESLLFLWAWTQFGTDFLKVIKAITSDSGALKGLIAKQPKLGGLTCSSARSSPCTMQFHLDQNTKRESR